MKAKSSYVHVYLRSEDPRHSSSKQHVIHFQFKIQKTKNVRLHCGQSTICICHSRRDGYDKMGDQKSSKSTTWVRMFLTLFTFVSKYKPAFTPHRPMAFPIVGNFPNLGAPGGPVHKIMYKLAQKHGDVMSFWFGNKYTVVVSHYKYFHEALKKKGNLLFVFSC